MCQQSVKERTATALSAIGNSQAGRAGQAVTGSEWQSHRRLQMLAAISHLMEALKAVSVLKALPPVATLTDHGLARKLEHCPPPSSDSFQVAVSLLL